jgi:hypothetical protein
MSMQLVRHNLNFFTKVQSNSEIQFASNQSKLVFRKLDLGPSSKVDLKYMDINNLVSTKLS